MRHLLLACTLATLVPASGCVVLRDHGVASSAASSKHPHGGPPGQQKNKGKGKAKGHAHGHACGHKAKKHKGQDVWHVDGRWVTIDGVVVVID